MFVLYFVNHSWLGILLFFLFLYLNAIQLTASWKRIGAYFWDEIYPVTFQEKALGFSRTIFTFLLFQVGAESIILGFQRGWGVAFVVCLGGILVSFLYAYPILQKRLENQNNDHHFVSWMVIILFIKLPLGYVLIPFFITRIISLSNCWLRVITSGC